jgi:hypothetical protein
MTGFFVIKLFAQEINSLEHPNVQKLKSLVESIGQKFNSKLATFKISHGVVSFKFDKEEFYYSIAENISDVIGVYPKLFSPDFESIIESSLRALYGDSESKGAPVGFI